ncbi:ABC transporter ATP-binding protein [Micromonospora sp. C41]|uniref:ABC transporter ATP-binding protein n=1 Tax=Micromonospora TaxID=1873 RepID=UPI001B388C83|nr:ABC transporter ATP-binding protein [Micromonospora sp. C41]MBQ1064417.1 ABC transporter ATP-binding protein [Micromonospora sp. C41]
MTPLVLASALTKTYGTRDALRSLDLAVAPGSRFVVLGHNGAGKSTLLEIIATLRTPTSGSVRVGGFDTVTQARDARRLIGLAPQSNALDPLATPAEVLDFHGVALGLGRRQRARRTRELVDLFGLGEHRSSRVAKLSGGTRRKLDLAVALVAEPAVVILDEPTTGLDPLARIDFWTELTRLNHSGTSLLISTQDLHEADVLATEIAVLRDGRVVAQGPPASLKGRVGARTLTLDLSDAAAATALVAASEAGFRADPDHPDRVRLSVPDDPRALTAALHEAGAIAADVTRLHLTEPSLDDVFVALAAR